MLIGAGRIVLDFYGNDNLAKKHREMEALCRDLRKKFNVSALEIADFDDPERCVLGFAAVIPENWALPSARSFVAKICEVIDKEAFTRVTVEDWDLYSHGDERPMIDDDDEPESAEAAAARARKSFKRRYSR